MKYIKAPFDNSFIFYEDGVMFSRKSGQYIKAQTQIGCHEDNKGVYYICNIDPVTKKRKYYTFPIGQNIIRYFGENPPKIEGVECRDMKRYQGKYCIYKDGRVWSLVQCKWMTASKNQSGYMLYCLSTPEKKKQTEYMHRLIAENFLIDGLLGDKEVHHQSTIVSQNNPQNLLVMTHEQHIQYHRDNPTNAKTELKQQLKEQVEEQIKQMKLEIEEQKKKADEERKSYRKIKQEQRRERQQYKKRTGKRMIKHTEAFWEKHRKIEELRKFEKQKRNEIRMKLGYKVYEHSEEYSTKKGNVDEIDN